LLRKMEVVKEILDRKKGTPDNRECPKRSNFHSSKTKVFARAFFKKLADSKDRVFGRSSQRAKPA
jgi:hypothetical protein